MGSLQMATMAWVGPGGRQNTGAPTGTALEPFSSFLRSVSRKLGWKWGSTDEALGCFCRGTLPVRGPPVSKCQQHQDLGGNARMVSIEPVSPQPSQGAQRHMSCTSLPAAGCWSGCRAGNGARTRAQVRLALTGAPLQRALPWGLPWAAPLRAPSLTCKAD